MVDFINEDFIPDWLFEPVPKPPLERLHALVDAKLLTNPVTGSPCRYLITANPGQWDHMLDISYLVGAVIVELDCKGAVAAYYQRGDLEAGK